MNIMSNIKIIYLEITIRKDHKKPLSSARNHGYQQELWLLADLFPVFVSLLGECPCVVTGAKKIIKLHSLLCEANIK